MPALAGAEDKFEFPVVASSKVLGFAPLWAADKKGFFEREGLDAEVTAIRGTAPTMQALVSDSIHVAFSANDGPIGLVEKGLDVAMIAGGSKTTHMIMGGKDFKTYEDLRGATIGSSTLTSGTAFLLRRMLKSHGLEYPKDYKLVNVRVRETRVGVGAFVNYENEFYNQRGELVARAVQGGYSYNPK